MWKKWCFKKIMFVLLKYSSDIIAKFNINPFMISFKKSGTTNIYKDKICT